MKRLYQVGHLFSLPEIEGCPYEPRKNYPESNLGKKRFSSQNRVARAICRYEEYDHFYRDILDQPFTVGVRQDTGCGATC